MMLMMKPPGAQGAPLLPNGPGPMVMAPGPFMMGAPGPFMMGGFAAAAPTVDTEKLLPKD